MPKTYPHQKWVKIHKTELTKDFLSIPNEEWNGLDKNEKNTIYSKKKIQACRGIGSAFGCLTA